MRLEQITCPPSSPYLSRDSRFFGEIQALMRGCQDKPAMTPRKWRELLPYPDRPLERLGPMGQFDTCFVSVQNAREQGANLPSEC